MSDARTFVYDDSEFDELLDRICDPSISSEERHDLGLSDAANEDANGPSGLRLVALTTPPATRNSRSRRPKRRADRGIRPDDLPDLRVPAGYRRDGRGTWRRAHDHRPVPHARDVTLGTLWGELVAADGSVWVPQALVLGAEELGWVAAVGVRADTTAGVMYVVDEFDWEMRSDWPLTIDAPELAPDRLVGVAEIASSLGVGESTVTAYVSRGRLPAPCVVIAGRPRWSWPILLQPGSPLQFKTR